MNTIKIEKLRIIGKQNFAEFDFEHTFDFVINSDILYSFILKLLKSNYHYFKAQKTNNFDIKTPIKILVINNNKIIQTLKQVEVKNVHGHSSWPRNALSIEGKFYSLIPYSSEIGKDYRSLISEDFNEKKYLETIEYQKLFSSLTCQKEILSSIESNKRRH